MSKLEIAKEIIKKYYKKANCGLFKSRNTAADTMCTLYSKNGLTIDICYGCRYFEVFGLSVDEFKELYNYYHLFGIIYN